MTFSSEIAELSVRDRLSVIVFGLRLPFEEAGVESGPCPGDGEWPSASVGYSERVAFDDRVWTPLEWF